MAKQRKSHHQSNVTPEQFVRAWNTSSSAVEVAQKLDMAPHSASARASWYRKKGVDLKRFLRGAKPAARLDVAALNKLAKSLA